MNFFNGKLKSKKYLKILSRYKKSFDKNFVLKNFGLFIGDQSLFKILYNIEILKKIKNVKGDIIEFGVWNGNSLIFMKKILDYLKIKKRIYGYDHFKGMPNKLLKNKFSGDINLIIYIIRFFNLDKVSLINDDISNLSKYKNKFKKFSLVYIDCDLYHTTKIILDQVSPKLSKGGFIVFDEANKKNRIGEAKAMKEFYSSNKKKFKKIILKKDYQPDVVLQKK